MSNNIKTAIYAGSFDPITLGHLDVLFVGAEMFDRVIIAVALNPEKKGFLCIEERIKLIKDAVKDFNNVEVDSFDGLTVEYAQKNGAKYLLRGVRSALDFEYEKELAQVNQKLAPDIKTVFVVTKPEHSYISSSAVREIISNHGDVSNFVPVCVKDYLISKF